eukprot:TRINITY_DN8561_c0_g1_i3.p3 TRINITY_DN8561_c0_g1~~TRINITY_DN8561_c0_g1_i3.p3  ORF type:complete len:147 (+),score=26.78 TRINITY_DN8561_c0_g1_i3:493-933(+)
MTSKSTIMAAVAKCSAKYFMDLCGQVERGPLSHDLTRKDCPVLNEVSNFLLKIGPDAKFNVRTLFLDLFPYLIQLRDQGQPPLTLAQLVEEEADLYLADKEIFPELWNFARYITIFPYGSVPSTRKWIEETKRGVSFLRCERHFLS